MTLVLRDARLADGRHVDVHVDGGLIARVEARSDTASSPTPEDSLVDDLRGWLLLPALAEPHAHLDKALTAELVPNPAGDLYGAIDAWFAACAAGLFTHDGIVSRAVSAMEQLVLNGVTAVRTHVNVGVDVGASSVVAVREAREQVVDLLDVQIVALTSSPMTGPDGAGNRAALVEALEVGVDLVGGCPHLDPDPPRHIRDAIAAATDAGIGLDLHMDETLDADMLTLRHLAHEVVDTGFEGTVAASHCVSLGMQHADIQRQVAAEVAEAGIAIVPLPQTNLFLQGRAHRTATPRGLTALLALREAGVLVAAGADNVQDPFNLVGRSDPLETAALLVMAGHVLPDEAFDMVSNNVRRAMGLGAVELCPGDPADLLAIKAASVRGAIAEAPHDRRVYRAGRLVASSATDRRLVRDHR
jgi:cytosine/creatinine deaminase